MLQRALGSAGQRPRAGRAATMRTSRAGSPAGDRVHLRPCWEVHNLCANGLKVRSRRSSLQQRHGALWRFNFGTSAPADQGARLGPAGVRDMKPRERQASLGIPVGYTGRPSAAARRLARGRFACCARVLRSAPNPLVPPLLFADPPYAHSLHALACQAYQLTDRRIQRVCSSVTVLASRGGGGTWVAESTAAHCQLPERNRSAKAGVARVKLGRVSDAGA